MWFGYISLKEYAVYCPYENKIIIIEQPLFADFFYIWDESGLVGLFKEYTLTDGSIIFGEL